MGLVTLDLPIVGQPNTSEDPKVRAAFQALQNAINGNLDGSNLSPGILSQLGNFQNIVNAVQVAEVGQVGQLRAGRVLTPADFTNMGLTAPVGLWNLSNLNDSSGNARNLTNKGSVTFDTGITGVASEAAIFTGSTAQALYIADTGGSDPFRIKTGSWGCWFRTAKRGLQQTLVSKWGTASQFVFNLWVTSTNVIAVDVSSAGAGLVGPTGVTDVADDRWHMAVATLDGTRIRVYIDGALDAQLSFAATLFAGSSPLNIGASAADGATAAVAPHYGRVDEAFVTSDVLSPEQVLNLYCASFSHTLGQVPTGTRLSVRRRKRGGTLTTANFPSQPTRLHNFTAGSLTDEGSGAVGLTSNPGTGAIVSVAGADGALGNAYSFSGAHTGLSATDTGLPSGTASRSFGVWFKTTSTAVQGLLSWGSGSGSAAGAWLGISGSNLAFQSGADLASWPGGVDGLWHFACAVEDNSAADGVKRKLYLDGRLLGNSTVLNSLTLGGANRLRVGADAAGTSPFTGQIDGAFVFSGALTLQQIQTLYNVGSQQLNPSPKSSEDHIEALESNRVLGRFDTIEGSDLINLAVIA